MSTVFDISSSGVAQGVVESTTAMPAAASGLSALAGVMSGAGARSAMPSHVIDTASVTALISSASPIVAIAEDVMSEILAHIAIVTDTVNAGFAAIDLSNPITIVTAFMDHPIFIKALIAIVLAIVYVGWFVRYCRITDSNGKQMPGPLHLIPYWGMTHLTFFMAASLDYSKYLRALINNQGDGNMVCIRGVQGKTIYIIGHPEYAKTLLGGHYMKFPKSVFYDNFEFYFGNGLVRMNGKPWQEQRAFTNPLFHFEALRMMANKIDSHARDAVVELSRMCRERNSFIVEPGRSKALTLNSDFIANVALDIICDTAFGLNPQAKTGQTSPICEAMNQINLEMGRVEDPLYNNVWRHLPWNDKARRDNLGELEKTIQTVTLERLNKNKQAKELAALTQPTTPQVGSVTSKTAPVGGGDDVVRPAGAAALGTDKKIEFDEEIIHTNDLLDLILIMAEKDDPSQAGGFTVTVRDGERNICGQVDLSGWTVSAKVVRDASMTFIGAGHETTSSAVQWLLYEVCQRPEIMRRMVEEVDSVMDSLPEDVVLGNELHGRFAYVNMVWKETLRVHPPVHRLARMAEEDCNIGPYFLKQNFLNRFVVQVNSLHNHPDYWVEPGKFDPERWGPERVKETMKSPFQYVPFSAGPRNCIGQRYATMEAVIILVRMLRNFTISMSKEQIKASYGKDGLTHKAHNLFFDVVERQRQRK